MKDKGIRVICRFHAMKIELINIRDVSKTEVKPLIARRCIPGKLQVIKEKFE
jgi:hypothetical protein